MAAVEQIAPGKLKINWNEVPVVNFNKNGNTYTTTAGSAITLKPGTIVNKPKSIIDVILDNWQLAALGILSIIILLKD